MNQVDQPNGVSRDGLDLPGETDEDRQRNFGRQFADEFCEAQLQREEAEYNPASRFALQEVEWRLMSVGQAITDFLAVPKKHRRAFAIYLLTEFRRSS